MKDKRPHILLRSAQWEALKIFYFNNIKKSIGDQKKDQG